MEPFLTIQELKNKLARKEITPSEVVQYYKARLKKYNPLLNCAIEIFEESQAKANLQPHQILDGIPCLIKDLMCQQGKITSAGSKILANYRAPYDATVVSRLKAAGAISLGRSNMDEFAMGASGEYSAYGPTKNPWDTTRVSGGSSSGSAAAVAAGLVPFALGSETGGSVRNPAAFCGLVGLYPTYGLHSRFGIIPFASSTDQVGPLTKTVYDNALVTSALSGQDPKDSTTIPMAPKDYTKDLDGKLPENFTLGILKEAVESDGIDPEITAAFKQAIEQFQKLGAKIKYVDIPNLKYGIALYFIISRAEGASNLMRFDGTLYGHRTKDYKNLEEMYIKTRQEGFGPEVKTRILTGNYVLSAGHKDAYYNKALQIRDMLRAEFEAAFKEVTLITSPTIPTHPFLLGQFVGDAVTMFLADYFNVPNCIIGTPGISVPCGYSKQKLPIGIQFLGPRLSESVIYKAAYAFEQSAGHHLKHPGGYE